MQHKKKKILVGVFIFVVFVVLVGNYRYNSLVRQDQLAQLENVSRATQLVSAQGNLISGDLPLIFTIKETASLPSDGFFVGSIVGDQMYLFEKSKLVALYRPGQPSLLNFKVLSSEEVAQYKKYVQ